jgi:predicted small metal-binding protein
MPFQPFNYANITPQGNPWAQNFVENLTKGFQAGRLPFETGQAEQKQDLENKKQQLANVMQIMLNREQPEKFSAEQADTLSRVGLNNANASNINTMTPLDAEKQKLANAMYNKVTQSQIDQNEANAYLRNSGGAGGGVLKQAQLMFNRAVAQDNPNLSPSQLYEATNVLQDGGDTLSDGTKLAPLSKNAMVALSGISKAITTNQALNRNLTGQQAGNELDVIGDYITRWQQPYGTTIFGISPQRTKDNFNTSDEAQDRLAKADVADELSIDQATLQNKINSGEATATITEELMKKGQQHIKDTHGITTARYRKTYMDSLKQALHDALSSRQSVPINAYDISNPSRQNKSASGNATLRYNPSTGKLEPI